MASDSYSSCKRSRRALWAALSGLAALAAGRSFAQDLGELPGIQAVGRPGCDGREYVYMGSRLLAIVPTTSDVSVSLAASGASFPEQGVAVATVTLTSPSGALACPVTVQFATADGTASAAEGDYVSQSGTVTFDPGSTTGATRTIAVPIATDTRYEPDETFTIGLGGPTGAVLGATPVFTATILNDDSPPRISVPDVSAGERSAGIWELSASLFLSNESASPVTVTWATANGSAVSPADFSAVGGSVTFEPRETHRKVSIPIVGDAVYEGDEQLFVNLSSPVGGTLEGSGQGRVTLVEDDPPAISVGDVHAHEGSASTKFTFTVSLQGPSHQPITVDYQTTDCTAAAPADYVPASGQISIPADAPGPATFDVVVQGELLPEPMEIFKVVLSSPVNAVLGDAVGEGSILDDDGGGTDMGGDGPQALARSDFDGDGRSDLLFLDTASGELSVWYLDGDTRRGPAVLLDPPKEPVGNWSVVGVNDFNADGKPDLLWRNADSGNLAFWFLSGVVRTGSALIPGISDLKWKVAGTGDFNADGRPDLLWREDNTGELLVWFLNGTTFLSARATVPSAPEDGAVWFVAGVGDLNADGKPDLLWRHATSGAVVYWLMDGRTKTAGGYVTPSPLDLAWTGAPILDVGLDQRNDLLFQHATTGAVRIHHMNGTNELCGSNLEPPPGPTQKLLGPK